MGEAAAPKEAKKSSQPQFGPYLLKRTVGEGEFGKVKLSIHSKTKKEVAIKLLKKERISTAARRAKVMREISMLQALDHPYIVKLIEVVETDAYIGLVMEYASALTYLQRSLSMKRNPTNWLWGKKGSGNGPTITPIHGEPEELPSADVIDVNRLSLAYSNSISNSHVGVLRDRKLRIHTGPVDTKALSTRDPLDLLLDMESLFEQKFGWIVQSNGQATGEYKLKVLKPRGVKVGKVEAEASSSETPASSDSTSTAVNIQDSGAINDPKMTQIVNSLPVSLVSRIKNFMYQLRPNASKGFDGIADVTKSDLGITGMEEEMTFTVEIQQIKDMRGTNVVEFRRLKGDVWGFKRLYIDVVERLPLSE
ncbi:hypothetical protein HDU99_004708 [Rhizoclosmatium hyalinum]|nr:hypothetical protein HDU99_004708 [Rhizoclosmatium hyalinum]